MRSRQIGEYIGFGSGFRYLQDAAEGWPLRGEGHILDNIDRFLECLDRFELRVTRRASHELVALRDELAELGSEHRLTYEESRRLSTVVRDVRKTLGAEAAGNVAFIVVDKRIDVQKLLDDVPALMAPDIFDALPVIAQYDLMEAGKCIAFERPTAAAFHLLRGTESMLKHFYCCIVRRNRARLMWGPMVQSLKKRKTNPPPKPLLDNLDNVRDNFRNPTQHPEKIYDIDEVQDLFPLCVDVLNRMVSFLE